MADRKAALNMCGAAKVRRVTRAAEGVVAPEGAEEGAEEEEHGVGEGVKEGVEEGVEGAVDPEGARSCGKQAIRS